MDLTSLGDDDTDEKIATLAGRALSPAGSVAALCVYPRFVPIAKQTLEAAGGDSVRVATVCVFPHGRADVRLATVETEACVAYGADEIDTVIPYRSLAAGDADACKRQLAAVRSACLDAKLKVILETGELGDLELVRAASRLAIEAGADFIKTSTGKVPVNATPAAAAAMLDVIAETNSSCGLKIAGGVRSLADAKLYLEMAAQRMGDDFLTPQRFRFGASSLLDALLETLGEQGGLITGGSY
jgi:deoxyribose-phosphate aldolase